MAQRTLTIALVALALAGCSTLQPIERANPITVQTTVRVETLKAFENGYAGAAEAFIAKGSPDGFAYREARAFEALEYMRSLKDPSPEEWLAAMYYTNFAINEFIKFEETADAPAHH